MVEGAVEEVGLRLRLVDRVPQLRLVEPVARSEEDAVPARRYGPECVLGLPRVADLPHGERVEGQRQPTRDLGCDRDAPAGEADDHRVARLGILEHRCESTTGVDAIVKDGAHTRIVGRLRVGSIVGTPDRSGRDYGSFPGAAGP